LEALGGGAWPEVRGAGGFTEGRAGGEGGVGKEATNKQAMHKQAMDEQAMDEQAVGQGSFHLSRRRANG